MSVLSDGKFYRPLWRTVIVNYRPGYFRPWFTDQLTDGNHFTVRFLGFTVRFRRTVTGRFLVVAPVYYLDWGQWETNDKRQIGSHVQQVWNLTLTFFFLSVSSVRITYSRSRIWLACASNTRGWTHLQCGWLGFVRVAGSKGSYTMQLLVVWFTPFGKLEMIKFGITSLGALLGLLSRSNVLLNIGCFI